MTATSPAPDSVTEPPEEEKPEEQKKEDELPRFVSVVEPDLSIIGRADIADRVVSALGRHTARPVLVAGAPGSGRTAMLSAIQERLQTEVGGTMSRHGMMRIECGRVVDLGGEVLRKIRDAAGPTVVIALDDLEALLGLGAHTFDADQAAVVRSMVHDPDLRLIATIDRGYLSLLEGREPELVAACEIIDLPVLDDETLRAIAEGQAELLEAHHQVTLPPDAAELAAGPPSPASRRAHPALLIARLDAACVHARLRGATAVDVGDIDVFHADPSTEVVDANELGAALRERVMGQDHAVEAVTARLALTSRQLDLSAHRPDGVFLFVGPTGVGKTELALALAEARFGDPSRVIRLDMSEYSKDHSVARLIGPPPGYIGSDEPGGWLTTRVRQQPRCVVLLDEIEKADPAVWMLLLQIFDTGRLTDGRGEVASFSDAVVIMTSNLGTGHHVTTPVGFASDGNQTASGLEERVRGAVRDAMPAELVNRFDQVVVFEPLSREVIERIAVSMVGRAVATVAERGWTIEVNADVVDLVARLGYDPAYGARHLKRAVEDDLLAALSSHSPGAYRATRRDDTIVWEPIPAGALPRDSEPAATGAPDAASDAAPLDMNAVPLRAAARFGAGEGPGRTVIVVAGGNDHTAIARLLVEVVADEIVEEEAAELLVDPMERAVAIRGLSAMAAIGLHRRLCDAGAEASVAGIAP